MRPYIICHMVASIDGRIDCSMVENICGDEYYITLEELNCPTLLEGRVTMQHYHATKEPFVPKTETPIGHMDTFVAEKSDAYMVSVDTSGRLQWESNYIDGTPLVCIISEKAPKKYLDSLRKQQISWIAVGKENIDLGKAMEILYERFGVRRLGLLGGGHINGGFLEAGLVDEVSLLLAPGIDGRKGQISLFDGISNLSRVPVPLKLELVKRLNNDIIWLRYKL